MVEYLPSAPNLSFPQPWLTQFCSDKTPPWLGEADWADVVGEFEWGFQEEDSKVVVVIVNIEIRVNLQKWEVMHNVGSIIKATCILSTSISW